MDEKTQYFKAGFDELGLQVRERYYTSVADFSQQLSNTIATRLSPHEEVDSDIHAIQTQLNESRGTAEHHALPQEQKEVKKLAKRILKAVKEPLAVAMRKEAELKGKEYEEEIRKLESMSMFASAKALDLDDSPMKANRHSRSVSDTSVAAGASPADDDIEMEEADERMNETVLHFNITGKKARGPGSNKKKSTPSSSGSSSQGRTTRNSTSDKPPTEPLSPPMSTDSAQATVTDPSDVFANGGVPWYLAPFDPEGTTIHEERYTGRAVLRDMSEELSDMDEDTLTELAVNGVETPKANTPRTRSNTASDAASALNAPGDDSAQKKKGKKRAKSNWSRPRRRLR